MLKRHVYRVLSGRRTTASCLLAGLVLSGCATQPDPWAEGAARVSFEAGASFEEDARRRHSPPESPPISDTHPYQINDYLIYPVKWGRAEDVAATVEALFQARYGPGVMVIPHVPTNKLLIYLPPPQERERAGASGRSGLRSSPRSPSPTSTVRGSTRTTRGGSTLRSRR